MSPGKEYAIRNAGYGPETPTGSLRRGNERFWVDKARRWNLPVLNARMRRCGNCNSFVLQNQDGSVGWCTQYEFNCSAMRTCNTWVPGGPQL